MGCSTVPSVDDKTTCTDCHHKTSSKSNSMAIPHGVCWLACYVFAYFFIIIHQVYGVATLKTDKALSKMLDR
jgi:hypothetical protein